MFFHILQHFDPSISKLGILEAAKKLSIFYIDQFFFFAICPQ